MAAAVIPASRRTGKMLIIASSPRGLAEVCGGTQEFINEPILARLELGSLTQAMSAWPQKRPIDVAATECVPESPRSSNGDSIHRSPYPVLRARKRTLQRTCRLVAFERQA